MKPIKLKSAGFNLEGISVFYSNMKDGKDGFYVRSPKLGKKVKSEFIINKNKTVVSYCIIKKDSLITTLVIKDIKELEDLVKYCKRRLKSVQRINKNSKMTGVVCHPFGDLSIIIKEG